MPILPQLGELTEYPGLPEWLTSAPIPIPFFSGTKLPIVIDDSIVGDDMGEGDLPEDVVEAIARFLGLAESERMSVSQRLYAHYRGFVEAVEYDELNVGEPTEIWDHVTPDEIHVMHRHGSVYIVVTCECGWDVEHGLQFVFRHGSDLTRISYQDGHITDADKLPEDLG